MPHSRHRHKSHAHSSAHPQPARRRPRRSATWLMGIFLALFGLAIGFFAAGASPVALVMGGLAGGIAGLLLGKKMDNSVKSE